MLDCTDIGLGQSLSESLEAVRGDQGIGSAWILLTVLDCSTAARRSQLTHDSKTCRECLNKASIACRRVCVQHMHAHGVFACRVPCDAQRTSAKCRSHAIVPQHTANTQHCSCAGRSWPIGSYSHCTMVFSHARYPHAYAAKVQWPHDHELFELEPPEVRSSATSVAFTTLGWEPASGLISSCTVSAAFHSSLSAIPEWCTLPIHHAQAVQAILAAAAHGAVSTQTVSSCALGQSS